MPLSSITKLELIGGQAPLPLRPNDTVIEPLCNETDCTAMTGIISLRRREAAVGQARARMKRQQASEGASNSSRYISLVDAGIQPYESSQQVTTKLRY